MNNKYVQVACQSINYLIAVSMFMLMVFVTDVYAKWGTAQMESGIDFQNEGRYPEAINEYYRVIEKEPQNLYAYYNLICIIEIVLEDFNSSIQLCDKAISIAENRRVFFNQGKNEIKKEDIDTLTSKIKERRKILIQKLFKSFEVPLSPRYMVIKSKLPVETQKGLRFLKIKGNKYQVMTSTGEIDWIKRKDVKLIYMNSNKRIELPVTEKIAGYKRIINNYSDNNLVRKSKERIDELYYELARATGYEEDCERYLAECPDGKHVQEVREILNKTGKKMPSDSGQSASAKNLDTKEIKQRLDEIEIMYNKGLITGQEKDKLRMDVLRHL